MGCCGDREKGLIVTEEQKWDYITLDDFRRSSCLTPLSYGWLWILSLIMAGAYVSDGFTAISLLAFNKWSSEIKPTIPIDIAKWIFVGSIIASYVLLAVDWIRAYRVIRSGGVANCYLDPLAVVLQSMRVNPGGKGWRRFLVFAELTKSKKGVDYIALFVYFQFKGAIVIIVAEGPRVVINALTLWAVMKASLIPNGQNKSTDGHSNFQQFFINLSHLAQNNRTEVAVYGAMLFTLVVWVIAALSLLVAVLLYVVFLWHYIPSSDGRLSIYLKRKIDARLDRIVGKKVKKALEKQDAKRRKEEQKSTKNGGRPDQPQRVPTLPVLNSDGDKDSIYSVETTTTLPPYTSRSNTMNTSRTGVSRAPTLPSFPEDVKRPMPPSRSETQSSAYSNASYGSNAPLLGQASDMGYGGRSASPTPSLPPLDRNADYFSRPPMNRGMTGSPGPQRPYSPMSQDRSSPAPSNGMPMRPENSFGPPSRINTNYTSDNRNSPSPMSANDSRPGQSPRSNTAVSTASRRGPGPSPLADPSFSPFDHRAPAHGPAYEMSPVDMSPVGPGHQQQRSQNQIPYQGADDYDPYRAPTPAQQGPLTSLIPGNPPPLNNGGNGYASHSATPPPRSNPGAAALPSVLQAAIQRREASNPLPNRGPGSTPPQRSATAPLQPPGWAQDGPRSQTAGPMQQQQRQQGYDDVDGYYTQPQAREW
ncbi:uncharacterized protein BDZ99DRAFT_503897 [Mytilinidion resinicola]|uniref:Vacuolar membrane protein n=1 Tax=Mytilinidion resinicola TaxID=574789 RepID=A0A6A6Y2L0_9PEZI|nr:uncharacterized protein BDZ99DRAFT_503897 [Mytilinidion resinicola]KAF2802445.1 hypothetical protein BDZ99DRAFT_503897 [Mytilinidion resinicola]